MKLLSKRVLIKPIAKKQEGLVIVPEGDPRFSMQAEVIAAAKDACVQKGDIVYYLPYSGVEIEYEGGELYIVDDMDILAVVEESA